YAMAAFRPRNCSGPGSKPCGTKGTSLQSVMALSPGRLRSDRLLPTCPCRPVGQALLLGSGPSPACPQLWSGRLGRHGRQATLPLLRQIVDPEPQDTSEADLKRRTLLRAGQSLAEDEVFIGDAGMGLAEILAAKVPR